MASGARQIADTVQRPKVNATGGMTACAARPSTQFPDQNRLHNASSR